MLCWPGDRVRILTILETVPHSRVTEHHSRIALLKKTKKKDELGGRRRKDRGKEKAEEQKDKEQVRGTKKEVAKRGEEKDKSKVIYDPDQLRQRNRIKGQKRKKRHHKKIWFLQKCFNNGSIMYTKIMNQSGGMHINFMMSIKEMLNKTGVEPQPGPDPHIIERPSYTPRGEKISDDADTPHSSLTQTCGRCMWKGMPRAETTCPACGHTGALSKASTKPFYGILEDAASNHVNMKRTSCDIEQPQLISTRIIPDISVRKSAMRRRTQDYENSQSNVDVIMLQTEFSHSTDTASSKQPILWQQQEQASECEEAEHECGHVQNDKDPDSKTTESSNRKSDMTQEDNGSEVIDVDKVTKHHKTLKKNQKKKIQKRTRALEGKTIDLTEGDADPQPDNKKKMTANAL